MNKKVKELTNMQRSELGFACYNKKIQQENKDHDIHF